MQALSAGGDDGPETANAGGGVTVAGRTPMELVKVIYKDVPENLHEPAARGVVQVLGKLQEEGKVVQTQGQRWLLAGKAAL